MISAFNRATLIRKHVICALIMSLVFCCAGLANAESTRLRGIQKLLFPRSVICWVEGTDFGDLILGARGRIDFVCVDRKLGDALSNLTPDGSGGDNSYTVPEWLRIYAKDYTKMPKKTLFVLKIQAHKPWEFDTSALFIGDYRIKNEDIITGVMLDPSFEIKGGINALPGDYSGQVSILVPSDLLKKTSLKVGYGEYSAAKTFNKKEF